jgi:hypothetical protein
MEGRDSNGIERLAAECPRSLSMQVHGDRRKVHIVGPDRTLQCLDRGGPLPSLERTDAQVQADAEFNLDREQRLERCRSTSEGRAFLEALELLGYDWSERAEMVMSSLTSIDAGGEGAALAAAASPQRPVDREPAVEDKQTLG